MFFNPIIKKYNKVCKLIDFCKCWFINWSKYNFFEISLKIFDFCLFCLILRILKFSIVSKCINHHLFILWITFYHPYQFIMNLFCYSYFLLLLIFALHSKYICMYIYIYNIYKHIYINHNIIYYVYIYI